MGQAERDENRYVNYKRNEYNIFLRDIVAKVLSMNSVTPGNSEIVWKGEEQGLWN